MLSDTYDALRINRCYHQGKSVDFIINEINQCSGSHFDPEVVRAFNNCFQEWEAVYTEETQFNRPFPGETLEDSELSILRW
jgi:HD-GYP domain-containing protein (c-di-GMP phosphodiesterase class II)